jgi:hypothetical protein
VAARAPFAFESRSGRSLNSYFRCCVQGLVGTWSLGKLAGYLVATGMVASISRETVRQILRAGGISWQAAKTWKASADPDFLPKTRRVLDLYDHPPADGRVICADLCRSRNYAEVRAA